LLRSLGQRNRDQSSDERQCVSDDDYAQALAKPPDPPVVNIEGRDLTIGYPDRIVGHGLDVTLATGEVLALLGPNGGGGQRAAGTGDGSSSRVA
jgi:ATPase subunit of ABC transporter with duplicated ATPase domains